MTRSLGRYLQPPTARERTALAGRQPGSPIKGPTLPARIGPVEFAMLGGMVAVRCPRELAPLLRQAGAMWEPGSRRWLVQPRRLGPLLRALRAATDLLFRQAGIDLDHGPEAS
jgi:hypothetical protein